MLVVRIKPPAKHEMLAALVAVLLDPDGLPNHFSQFAIGLIAALIGGLHMLGVGLDARQWCSAFALRGFTRASSQLSAGHLGADFRHCHSPISVDPQRILFPQMFRNLPRKTHSRSSTSIRFQAPRA
jgi:hypothetical protein